jgi:hypothetical protein
MARGSPRRCVVRLCECGCGQTTRIATRTSAARGERRGEPNRFLKGHNGSVNPATGAASSAWNGGKAVVGKGYIGIYRPDHPRAVSGYVLEHVLIAERALGKALTAEHPVHPFDEVRTNNTNDNLVVCEDQAYHSLLHVRQRAFNACGDANARRCYFCKQYGPRDSMVHRARSGSYHPECHNQYQRARRVEMERAS